MGVFFYVNNHKKPRLKKERGFLQTNKANGRQSITQVVLYSKFYLMLSIQHEPKEVLYSEGQRHK